METTNENKWINIKDDLPPTETEVLFKIKNGRKYVGHRHEYIYKCDGTKEIVYHCTTARGSEVTGIKPVAWMYIPD